MSNHLIMVVDSDPKNLQILKENLEASGFQVITVADGTKALEEISRTTPKLVLTEINLPGLTGFQLLEKLQADPNTSFIPLIFLTNQREVQQRVRSFQMGAKDYLIKPLHVKEVIAHIRMVLRRIEKRQSDRSDQYTKLSGRLEELSLADLIESFSVERKTGILTLNNDNNKTGHVYFRDGAVINATLGDVRLENAIYQMLPWSKGYFNMVFKEVDTPDEISISNLGLLLEGVKRMERREELLRKFPSPKTSFTITPTFKKIIEKKKLPEDVKKFISLFDGKRSLKKIIDDSCYEDFKTLERLLRLYQQGFIKPTIAPKVTPRPPIKEKIQEETKIEEIPTEIEHPAEPVEKPKIVPEIPELPSQIRHRIEEQRSEIIIPEEPEITDKKDIDKAFPPTVEPTKEPETAEETKPPVPPTFEEPIAPVFDREEFMRKQKPIDIKKKWEEEPVVKEPTETESIQTRKLRDLKKNQLLTIGMDEDSLDEVMDILTDNTFQTKKFEMLDDLPIHFGKIALNAFNFITLLGVFINKSFIKLIGTLSQKLIGSIIVIDCTKDDTWEYANYLIHTMWDNFHLPYVVVITNFHDQNSITMDVVRYKLNIESRIPVIAWDANDKSSIKELLSTIIFPQESEMEKPSVMLEEPVEKVTV